MAAVSASKSKDPNAPHSIPSLNAAAFDGS